MAKRQGYIITTTATRSDGPYTFTTPVNSKSAIQRTQEHIKGWLKAHGRELISMEVKPA